MKRSLSIFLVTGLVIGSMTTARASGDSRTLRVPYSTSFVPMTGLVMHRCTLPVECVDIQTFGGESSLTASVVDAHGQPVSVSVMGPPPNGAMENDIEYGSFCGETAAPISFPPGTSLRLVIGYWEPGDLAERLTSCAPMLGTTGTVTVTLSRDGGGEEAVPAPVPAAQPSSSPQPSPTAEPASVERSVDLTLSHHLRAVGSVVTAEASCRAEVPVIIQRKRSGTWRDIATSTTDADGVFAVRLADRQGAYRVMAPEVLRSACLAATSAVARHRH